jgi:UDP:flavonoid glycosyltransferase YjiC (YdhE family)
LNTVLDSLGCGVPLITVPITYEQPAIAYRVERCGAGVTVPFTKLKTETLRDLARKVLGSPEYRDAARKMAKCIASAGGIVRAADIIEGAIAR